MNTGKYAFFIRSLISYLKYIPIVKWAIPKSATCSYKFISSVYFTRPLSLKEVKFLYNNLAILCDQSKILLTGEFLLRKDLFKAQKILKYLESTPQGKNLCDLSFPTKAAISPSSLYAKIFELDRMEDFINHIKNKSIAVVGNSPCEKGLKKGQDIDNHDIVFRFNNAYKHLHHHKNDYGSKISVLVHAGVEVEYSEKYLQAINYILFLNPNRHRKHTYIHDILKIYKNFPSNVVFPSIKHIRLMYQNPSHIKLSSGINLLYLLKVYNIKADIYGFMLTDQEKGTNKHFYSSQEGKSKHKWDREAKLLDQLRDYHHQK